MAQNAKSAALTDELLHSILQFDPESNRKAYKRARDVATRGLRTHQYARTNQFDVQSAYAGLDEKFRVLNRDDLAGALDERIKEINERRGKWMPEYLHLLLLLSDRPTENSKVEALELLRPPTPPKPLVWKQILEQDPYSDEEIWKDIDYRDDSSEDEAPRSVKKAQAKASPPSSVEEDDMYGPETCVIPTDSNIAERLRKSQFWKLDPADDEDDKIEVTELQAIRESLFMLGGMPTSLYQTDRTNSTIRVNQNYVLSHAIQKTTNHLLSELATIGREVYRLRQWTKRPSSLPLIQTFEAAVGKRLAEYDRALVTLQKRYLIPENPVVVSLLELHNGLRDTSRPIIRLAQLVADIEPQLLINPFTHLETLFDQIALAQMTLEKDIFDYFSSIFFECLQTYLKPIRRWMESGELGFNDETFFVFEDDSGSENSSLWHDRFVLRRGKENALRSPSFLQPAAQRIFNTGKSVVFLKELSLYGAGLVSSEPEPRLDHRSVCGASSDMPLSPFSELFQSAFQAWISSKYSLASTVLREHLFRSCGLMNVLKDLKILYLSADGSVFQDFADAIFERMDAGQRGWSDRFLLNELARGIFGTVITRPRADKVMVRAARSKTHGRTLKGLANVSLDYALPWPIMNIIQRSSVPIYQQMFTFLLQVYRAKYLLQRVSAQSILCLKDARQRQLSFKLRQRLIWFADILRSYLTETVILLSTEVMNTAMAKAGDIDDMATIHMKYVARLQEQALLSENLKPIHKAIVALLDLGVGFSQSLFPSAQSGANATKHPLEKPKNPENETKPPPKSSRRKSFIPAIVENDSSDSDSDQATIKGNSALPPRAASGTGLRGDIDVIEKEFDRLLPFVTAGLRNVGRVGAEPVWEMLADRLEWGGRR